MSHLQHPVFLLVLGDQVAAGHDATGLNGVGGKGFARMLLNNPADIPAWDGLDLATRFPELVLVDVAREGATSTRTRANLERALTRLVLPAFIEGDLLVLLHAGANDVFSRPEILLDTEATREAASALRTSLAIMISILRKRYEKPPHRVVVLVGNIIDPSDGTGALPGWSQEDGSPVPPDPRVVAHLDLLNRELALEVERRGAWLVDAHAVFLGHGLTAGEDAWLAPDGQALLDVGHDALRQAAWRVLTADEESSAATDATQRPPES